MAFTRNQTRTAQLWLALAVLLAVFPPFEIHKHSGSGAIDFGGSIHHGFVLDGGVTPVNIAGMPGNSVDTSTMIGYFLIKNICGAALLCEMIVLTGLCGILFVRSRAKD